MKARFYVSRPQTVRKLESQSDCRQVANVRISHAIKPQSQPTSTCLTRSTRLHGTMCTCLATPGKGNFFHVPVPKVRSKAPFCVNMQNSHFWRQCCLVGWKWFALKSSVGCQIWLSKAKVVLLGESGQAQFCSYPECAVGWKWPSSVSPHATDVLGFSLETLQLSECQVLPITTCSSSYCLTYIATGAHEPRRRRSF